MSANEDNNVVRELLTFRAEDKIILLITETVNDDYCHVMPLLLFRKHCGLEANAIVLNVMPITLLLFLGCRHAV